MNKQIEVMVVDDEPDIRFMLRTYLTKLAGFDMAREASNGADAVEEVRLRCPQAVLIDIGMPVMDGIEATRLIHQICPKTKIIILSAFTAPQLIEEAKTRGADLYLEKTTPPKDIAAAIERLCRAA